MLSLFLRDAVDAGVILAIILLSGFLGFWRERGAADAVQALVALVRVEAEARRDGRVRSLPLEEIVPGDVVVLNAGDLVPGDSLILQSNQLLVDGSSLARSSSVSTPTSSPVCSTRRVSLPRLSPSTRSGSSRRSAGPLLPR